MKNNLPVINTDLLEQETELAVVRCPTNAIVWMENQQFQDSILQWYGVKQTTS
jgi:hypothetical protein